MASFRGFVAVPVPPLPPLLYFREALAATRADLTLVRPENLHVTLRFLGEVDGEHEAALRTILEGAVAGLRRFESRLEGAGTFPPRGPPRIVWAGLSGADALSAVAGRLETAIRELGFAPEERAFRPHVTVARARSSRGASAVRACVQEHEATRFGAVPISEVRLVRSDLSSAGPSYSTVCAVALEA
ncbi:MAG TPA: RNA 2',3'-cyclic phosphodiesterase [Candidatus Thermoplasmatota archaeon]|nr:RNA 2',3'-cyclic phosphodiesterase [Candidatus Thermoplasmatota archaeon]